MLTDHINKLSYKQSYRSGSSFKSIYIYEFECQSKILKSIKHNLKKRRERNLMIIINNDCRKLNANFI